MCGACSENRKFLESSRSGAPKRVCDKCFANERGYGGSGSAAGQGIGDEDDDGGAGDGVAKLAVEDDAAYPRRTAVGRLPDVPLEEAVAALRDHPFDGPWQAILLFTVVDMHRAPGRGEGEGACPPRRTADAACALLWVKGQGSAVRGAATCVCA